MNFAKSPETPSLADIAMLGQALLVLSLTALPQQVLAQEANTGVSLGPSQNVQQPAPAVAPAEERLFGDWGGVRTSLGNLGIKLTIDFTSEFASNISGGTEQGSTFANQIGFEADIDWDKLAGIRGFSTHTVIANRSGSSDSVLFGDHVNAVQEIYGGGGDVVAHFVYAYGEESLDGGQIDIAAGRIPVLNDFGASPLYCDFMNVSICGNPGMLTPSDPGFSVYPDATWGGRIRVKPTEQTYVQAGAYEVSQGLFEIPYFRSGWNFDTSKDSGVEFPVEIGYEPQIGGDKLPGHYKIGVGFDTSNDKDLYLDSNGDPALLSGLPFANHHGKLDLWALADQMLLRNGPGGDDGLILLGAFVHGDPATSTYQNQYTAGLLDRAFWSARPQDSIGALVTYQEMSGSLGKEQALEQDFGMPIANEATGIQTSEVIFEINYSIHVMSGVDFQPDFQYVVRPNAETDIRNATVLGFRTHVNF